MKKLLIWDFDGVITGSWEIAFEMTKKQFPDMNEHDHRNLFNGNIYEAVSKLTKTGVSDSEFEEYLKSDYYPRKNNLLPIPGIAQAIKELSEEFDMVINTSSTNVSVNEYLTRHGLRQYFEKIYGIEISRSKEEKFKMILAERQILPEDCVMITDTVGDVLEARVYGIPSVISLWGYQLRNHFEGYDNLELVDSPADLAAVVKKHFLK